MNKSGYARYISIPVIILLIVITSSAIQTKNVQQSNSRMLFINDISGLLVKVASKLAHERGLTVSGITKTDILSPVEIGEIAIIRKDSNKDFISLIGAIEQTTFIESDYKKALISKLSKKLDTINAIRTDVNPLLNNRLKETTHDQWVDVFNQYRSVIDEMGRYNDDLLHEIDSSINLKSIARLKHLIWKASELAGRDRAFISVILSSNKKFQDLIFLQQWLADNENSYHLTWKELLSEIKQSEISKRIDEASTEEPKNYYEDLHHIRENIVNSSSSNTSHQIEHKEWFNHSTSAINSLLEMNKLLTDYAKESTLSINQNNKNLSLIIGIICITFVIFVSISSFMKFSMRRRVNIFKQFHNLSDHLLFAVSHWAAERGMMETSLKSNTILTKEVKDKISFFRNESSRAFAQAYTLLLTADFSGKNRHLIEFEKLYAEIQKLRSLADKIASITEEEKLYLLENWFKCFTQLIEKTEELHLVALHLANYKQIDNNYIYESAQVVTLKHFIWIMSEHAGRERGKIGAAISSVTYLPTKDLIIYRDKIQEAWKIVKEGISSLALQDKTKISVSNVEQFFFEQYNDTRNIIIQSGWCSNYGNDPCSNTLTCDVIRKHCLNCPGFTQDKECQDYSIMPLEWFNISTKAINNLNELSSDVSKATAKKMIKDQKSELYHFISFMIGLIVISSGLIYSFVLS